jgi:hypothetical protein
VVDLSRVNYVDSVGLNVLFDVAESLSGRQMRLASVVPRDGLVRGGSRWSRWTRSPASTRTPDGALTRIRVLMATEGR